MMLTIIEKWGSHVKLQMYTRLNISHGGLNNRRHFLFSFLFYFVNVKDENVKKKKWNVLNSLRSESLSALHNSIILTNFFFCSLMFVGKLHHLYFFFILQAYVRPYCWPKNSLISTTAAQFPFHLLTYPRSSQNA